jgi:hypothetical protein
LLFVALHLYAMSQTIRPKKVAFLTAGGLAPCLSSAVGGLIERYTEIAPDIELIAYRSGYKGLLLGDSLLRSAPPSAPLPPSSTVTAAAPSATAASNSPTSKTA